MTSNSFHANAHSAPESSGKEYEMMETARLLQATRPGPSGTESSGYQSISSTSTKEPSLWLHEASEHDPSLPEYHGSVPLPSSGWFPRLKAFIGPGAMVAVGYMDPGNWSTDIAGGSAFGYDMLFVILVSSFVGMFLQYLALKVGIATDRDLAQVCRDAYPPYVVTILWIVMEIAIIATDIAEVLGAAIALNLLFGLPLLAGVLLTSLDVLLLLFLNTQTHAFRVMEALVVALIVVIMACFTAQLVLSSPHWTEVARGLLPQSSLVTDPPRLFVAVGILGATVMPHNLFLHSSLVLTRAFPRTPQGLRDALHFSALDSHLSLALAFLVNASILLVSAATFHAAGELSVTTLQQAYTGMNRVLDSRYASGLFAAALLASGQNATLMGTLTGQIVMEGFMAWRLTPSARRMVTRGLAIAPAWLAVRLGGEDTANHLLLLSQVVLSFTLPFALVPLVHISSLRGYMGPLVNATWVAVLAGAVTAVVVVLNVLLMWLS